MKRLKELETENSRLRRALLAVALNFFGRPAQITAL